METVICGECAQVQDVIWGKVIWSEELGSQSNCWNCNMHAKFLTIVGTNAASYLPVAHKAFIAHSSDRVLVRSDRSRNEMKTIGWKTRCSCGELIETKNNSIKTHTAKVQRHLVKAGS
jgi:hypothetical protein